MGARLRIAHADVAADPFATAFLKRRDLALRFRAEGVVTGVGVLNQGAYLAERRDAFVQRRPGRLGLGPAQVIVGDGGGGKVSVDVLVRRAQARVGGASEVVRTPSRSARPVGNARSSCQACRSARKNDEASG